MIGSGERSTWTRCLVVWAIATLAMAGLLAWLRSDLSVAPAATFEDALVRLAAVAAAAGATWLWALTSLTVLAAATGRTHARIPGCPRRWRRLVMVACGVAAVTGLTAPAHADPGPDRGPDDRGAALVRSLPLPERPLGSGRPRRDAAGPVAAGPVAAPTTRAPVIVVAAGDSLWSIAASRLPDGAGDRQVAEAWQRLYAANRRTVGPNPDLIHPGQRLRTTGGSR